VGGGLVSAPDAVLSDCGTYRYKLTRTWDERIERVTFVMLNPSTADATVDDPTIRRCAGFAKAWGFGGLSVVNLYALRATNPRDLWTHPDPVGPDNDLWLTLALTHSSRIVAAWGANAKPDRVARFWQLAEARLDESRGWGHVSALRVTKSGAPGHPLYIPADAELKPYAEAQR